MYKVQPTQIKYEKYPLNHSSTMHWITKRNRIKNKATVAITFFHHEYNESQSLSSKETNFDALARLLHNIANDADPYVHTAKILAIDAFGSGLRQTVPRYSGFLSHLKVMDLRHNKLAGPLPDGIGQYKSLEILYLGNNKLSGKIPYSFGFLRNLKLCDLSNNNFTGTLPPTIRSLVSLEELNISGNKRLDQHDDSLANLPNAFLIRDKQRPELTD